MLSLTRHQQAQRVEQCRVGRGVLQGGAQRRFAIGLPTEASIEVRKIDGSRDEGWIQLLPLQALGQRCDDLLRRLVVRASNLKGPF